MTGIDKTLLRHLLLIDGHWEIGDYQIDMRKRRCDVWVGPQLQRDWLGRPKKNAKERTTQHTWQHLSFGPLRFVLHVTVPAAVEVEKRPSWLGDPGMPFTSALAQQVFFLFNEGLTLQSVCKVMGLSLNDVWRYRFALDNGLAQVHGSAPLEPAMAPVQRAAVPAAAAAQAAAVADVLAVPAGNVPDVADPVWMQLASGAKQLDIKVLSLKLMLTRVRSQLEMISDDEVRLLKLRDLHRYFLKNERVLTHELSQLRAA